MKRQIVTSRPKGVPFIPCANRMTALAYAESVMADDWSLGEDFTGNAPFYVIPVPTSN